jgi:hypothetical protein
MSLSINSFAKGFITLDCEGRSMVLATLCEIFDPFAMMLWLREEETESNRWCDFLERHSAGNFTEVVFLTLIF